MAPPPQQMTIQQLLEEQSGTISKQTQIIHLLQNKLEVVMGLNQRPDSTNSKPGSSEPSTVMDVIRMATRRLDDNTEWLAALIDRLAL